MQEKEIPFRIFPEEIDGDYICPVCNEPWDRRGVLDGLKGRKDGDMSREEAELFLNGWGCPCCASNIPNRIDDIKDSLELLERFSNSLEYLPSLFRAEIKEMKEMTRKLEEMLYRIWDSLEEELNRIKASKT